MPNEKAVRMTAPEDPGLQLLKGKIWGLADLGKVRGIRKVLFNVGSYTCKAYGATADMIKEKQGQIVELRGQWDGRGLHLRSSLIRLIAPWIGEGKE
jgi:hypothetical protein